MTVIHLVDYKIIMNIMTGHLGRIQSMALLENNLITGSNDGILKLWKGNQCLDEITAHSNSSVNDIKGKSSEKLLNFI